MGAKQSVDAPEPTGQEAGPGLTSSASVTSVDVTAEGAPDISESTADAVVHPRAPEVLEEVTSKPAETNTCTPVVAESAPAADATEEASAPPAAAAAVPSAAADIPTTAPDPDNLKSAEDESAACAAEATPEREADAPPAAGPVQEAAVGAAAGLAPAEDTGAPVPAVLDSGELDAPAGQEVAGDPSLEEVGKESKDGKVRTLEQMMSLKPGDDERTEISKKISWILRHGAKKVNVDIDADGWVKVKDLIATDILSGVAQERLLEIIENSNSQKTRYELKDAEDGQIIRAISKNQRRSDRGDRSVRAERLDRPDRGDRRERRRDGEMDADAPERFEQQPEQQTLDHGERRDRVEREVEPIPEQPAPQAEPRRYPQDRGDRGDRPIKGKSKGSDDRGGWWQRDQAPGPTFEEQLAEGFRPVYQGEKVVAMVRDNETVRPGRKGGDGPPPEQRHKGGYGCKGERSNGKGKSEKGFGKGYKAGGDQVGDAEENEGWKGGNRYGGRGCGYRDEPPQRSKHWRVNQGQDAIVRESEPVESPICGTLLSGTLVMQIGDDKVLKNGIVRMMVEAVEPQAGIKGWVTRSAEAAGGPIFFKPDRAPRDRNVPPRGGRGKGFSKGGGRRPVGAGEGPGRGDYNVE